MVSIKPIFDFTEELKAFDDTKAGVKGLVDSGITQIPPIFTHHQLHQSSTATTTATISTIDLQGITHDAALRSEAIVKIKQASETWGFFQVVNHDIPREALDEALASARSFFDQDVEIKQRYYTRDVKDKSMVYVSNFDLFTRGSAADWRDSFRLLIAPEATTKEELPLPCREVLVDYGNQVLGLGRLLLGLISEGLGLGSEKLLGLGCADGLTMVGHYYPPCPEPEKTMGTTMHQDSDFMTVLLPDMEIGGLQVKHEDEWIDVPPLPGALVVNIGDLLQLITNDKLKSVEHRVLANRKGPRMSIACFFTMSLDSNSIVRPIEELTSKDNPSRYRETSILDYIAFFRKQGLGGTSALSHFKI